MKLKLECYIYVFLFSTNIGVNKPRQGSNMRWERPTQTETTTSGITSVTPRLSSEEMIKDKLKEKKEKV